MNTVIIKSKEWLLLGILLTNIFLVTTVFASDAKKAEYLVTFAHHIQWSHKPTILHYCVIGSANVASQLKKQINNKKTIKNRKLVFRNAPKNFVGCEVAFIGTETKSNIKSLLNSIPSKVLTVSDIDNFLSEGGMIVFFGKKPYFQIHHGRAKQAGIIINSQLMRMSRKKP